MDIHNLLSQSSLDVSLHLEKIPGYKKIIPTLTEEEQCKLVQACPENILYFDNPSYKVRYTAASFTSRLSHSSKSAIFKKFLEKLEPDGFEEKIRLELIENLGFTTPLLYPLEFILEKPHIIPKLMILFETVPSGEFIIFYIKNREALLPLFKKIPFKYKLTFYEGIAFCLTDTKKSYIDTIVDDLFPNKHEFDRASIAIIRYLSSSICYLGEISFKYILNKSKGLREALHDNINDLQKNLILNHANLLWCLNKKLREEIFTDECVKELFETIDNTAIDYAGIFSFSRYKIQHDPSLIKAYLECCRRYYQSYQIDSRNPNIYVFLLYNADMLEKLSTEDKLYIELFLS